MKKKNLEGINTNRCLTIRPPTAAVESTNLWPLQNDDCPTATSRFTRRRKVNKSHFAMYNNCIMWLDVYPSGKRAWLYE